MWTWIVITWVLCIVCFIIGMLAQRAFADFEGVLESQPIKALEETIDAMEIELATVRQQLNEQAAENKHLAKACKRMQHEADELINLVNLYRAKACDMSDLFKSDLQANHAEQG